MLAYNSFNGRIYSGMAVNSGSAPKSLLIYYVDATTFSVIA
jgi:hypothetical protein